MAIIWVKANRLWLSYGLRLMGYGYHGLWLVLTSVSEFKAAHSRTNVKKIIIRVINNTNN